MECLLEHWPHLPVRSRGMTHPPALGCYEKVRQQCDEGEPPEVIQDNHGRRYLDNKRIVTISA